MLSACFRAQSAACRTWMVQVVQSVVSLRQSSSPDRISCKPEKHCTWGGILRDPHDRFIAAFAQSVSHNTSAQHAELAALWKGLNFLDQKGIKQAEVETDCLLAAHAIHSPEDLSELSNLGVTSQPVGELTFTLFQ
ncbi:hypothetical protein ACLB2K_045273 [Fragaria x ananassa]